jgi:hypothetical protein
LGEKNVLDNPNYFNLSTFAGKANLASEVFKKEKTTRKNIKRERDDNNIFFLNFDINLNKRLRVFTPSTQTKRNKTNQNKFKIKK